jgi:phosphatidylglycerophosphate synthase
VTAGLAPGDLYALKPRFARWLDPLAAGLARRQVSPSWLTALAVLVALGMGLSLLLSASGAAWLWVVALGAPLRLVLNLLDGDVARRQGRASAWGEVENELGDRLADLAVFGALASGPFGPQPWGVAALAMTLLVSFVAVLGGATVGFRPHQGPAGKPERMLGLAAVSAAVALGASGSLFSIYLAAVAVLGLVTVLRRLAAIHDHA